MAYIWKKNFETFLERNWILIQMSLIGGYIDHQSILVQMMACYRTCDKTLPDPMIAMISLYHTVSLGYTGGFNLFKFDISIFLCHAFNQTCWTRQNTHLTSQEAELHDRVGIDVFNQGIYNWLLLLSKGQGQHLAPQVLVKWLFWCYIKTTI